MKLSICAILVVCSLFPAQLMATNSCPEDICTTANQFGQLERDIPSLYLVNGLNLSQEQCGRIVEIMEKIRKIEEKFDGRFMKLAERRKKDFEWEANAVVDMSAAHGKVNQDKLDRSPRAERLKASRQELNTIRHEKIQELDELADKASGVLTDSQRAVINNFTPCFIPPSDFKNPERVGQAASDTTIVEAVLTRMRTAIDAKKLADAHGKALDQLVPYAMEKRHIRYTEEAEQEIRDEIGGRLDLVVNKMRNMSDADFQLEKANLAARTVPIPSINNSPDAVRWKVSHYVLNQGIVDVMRSRASGGKKPAAAEPARSASPEVAGRERSIGAAAVLNSIDLTKDQATKLLPVVRNALQVEKEVNDEINGTMKTAIEPYLVLRNKLFEGQTTPQAEGAAAALHGKVRNLRQVTMVQKLLECETEMDRILTAKQVDFLSADMKELKAMLVGKGSDEDVDKSLSLARSAVSDARRMSGAAYSKEKEQICRRFNEDSIKAQDLEKDAIDIEAETKRLAEVLDRARKLDETAYSGKRDDIAADFCPRRIKARPATFGAQYVHGEPVRILNPTTRLIFSEAGIQILQKMAAN
ncbi:MAG: hypothetical protein C0404_04885 [Verrucomicrobia bacterium]|nr:hypothetical protein [Verrucomicrobiota bacterium]